jgi:quinol monooxygenase YgiN
MFESQLLIVGSSEYNDVDYPTVLQNLRTQAESTLKDDGCIEFSITIDPSNPGQISVFERWETEEQHQRHLGTEHVRRYRESVAAVRPIRRSLNRYIVAEGSELYKS